MSQHPDLVDEQAYIDFAYTCLERSREDAWRLRDLTEAGRGGTHQNRYERDVFEEALYSRLTQLDLHDSVLVFGRIDRLAQEGGTEVGDPSSGEGVESFHLGRLAVADEEREPVVIDWRAPVAEPFYRATGRNPMGLARRRHFAMKGRQLLDIEDELFGEGHLGIGTDIDERNGDGPGLRGYSTLIAALEQGRTGRLGDIVATIQGEQDEIIRSPQAGVLVVQGGPGTGKTVVALHRAAYLLYTLPVPARGPGRAGHRAQPPVPALHRAGAAVARRGRRGGGRAHRPRARRAASAPPRRRSPPGSRATPAWPRSSPRRWPTGSGRCKEDLVVPFGLPHLRLRAAEQPSASCRPPAAASARHNAGRRFVEGEVFAALAASGRDDDQRRDRARPRCGARTRCGRRSSGCGPCSRRPSCCTTSSARKALLRLAGRRAG